MRNASASGEGALPIPPAIQVKDIRNNIKCELFRTYELGP